MKRIGLGILFLAVLAPGVCAQDVRVIPRTDGTAWIYHQERLPQGHGVRLYRDGVLISDTIATAVRSGADLEAALGDDYANVEASLEQGSSQQTLLRLRADAITAQLFTWFYPGGARALGRLLIDENAPAGQTVTYRVEVVDDEGTPSGQNLDATTALVATLPAAPTGLVVTNDGPEVTLTWRYPRTTETLADHVPLFFVYREAADGTRVRIDATGERIAPGVLRIDTRDTHTFTYTADAAPYTYTVTAADMTRQESAPSNAVTHQAVDNVPPALPKAPLARVTADNKVELTWDIAPEPDAAAYHLHRARNTASPFTRITDEPLDLLTTVYVDSSHTRGGPFHYKLSVIDASGNESELSNSSMAILEDRIIPDPVTGLNAAFADGQVELSWQASTVPSDFRTYVVMRQQLGGRGLNTFARLNDQNVITTSYVDLGQSGQGLDEGAVFRYGVAVADSARNHSDTVFVDLKIPDLTPPDAPRSVDATVEEQRALRLQWLPVRAADATTYTVYRDGEAMTQLDATRTAWLDEQVTKGQAYRYTVTATDSLGNESMPSEAAEVTMRDGRPPRPVPNIIARPSRQGGATIHWTPITAADLAGYRIYRAEIATGVYTQVGEVGFSAAEWRDPEGDIGHWYRVIAVDTSGNESRPSRNAEVFSR
ncbi:MAG: hypothetical protein AAGJ10_05190 [Bacteroidota bacterium]